MTDTTPEAVERLIDRIHESKAGRDVRTDASATLRALSAEVARLKAPGEPVSWKSIADAPYDTPLTIRVGGMTFGAILRRGASETTDGDPCDQWQALIADEHPPCWTDGACWEINADGYGSREPEAWRTIAAQTPPEDVGALVADAMAEATKAMRKFPQPNYVISKVAEEAGEVVKAAIHCAEGRERPEAVRGEIVQCMAMLIRLYLEGDQVHGLAALAKQGGETK